MNKKLILVLDRFAGESLAWLQTHSEYETLALPDIRTAKSLADFLITASINSHWVVGLITRSKFQLNQTSLEMLPHLEAFVTATVGFDHIDFIACKKRNIKLAYCPHAHSASAAELTWALLLACAKKLPKANRATQTGIWNRSEFMGVELAEKTHGIFGLGRIGSRVAQIAQAFGMQTIAYDPYRDDSWFQKHNTTRVGVDELFHLADSISIHAPLTFETKGRVHRIHLATLKEHSILINTARGGILNEEDLILHLKKNGPGFFGLDVLQEEPLRTDSDLLKYPDQVILTPHIGANTFEAFQAVSYEAARNLIALLRNKAISTPLPPLDEWFLSISGPSELAGTARF